jgi:nuclease-like protein
LADLDRLAHTVRPMPANLPVLPEPPPPVESERHLRLRYTGECSQCGKSLPKGIEALYNSTSRTVRCIVCEAPSKIALEKVDDLGTAGRSAHNEYERRHLAREARVKGRLGDILGGVVLAITDDPQSTRAWERGSIGERKLAEALVDVPDIKLLHDRRVPGTRGNIDHIVVAPAGVFVVDAKFYKGLIQIRDVGGFFKTDKRLYVGKRDCSHLAENMRWQVQAVQLALQSAEVQSVPITPVLCFVEGEWPLLFPPEEYLGVRLEGKRSIKKLLSIGQGLQPEVLAGTYRALAIAFPAK